MKNEETRPNGKLRSGRKGNIIIPLVHLLADLGCPGKPSLRNIAKQDLQGQPGIAAIHKAVLGF